MKVYGTKLNTENRKRRYRNIQSWYLNKEEIIKLFENVRPDYIFNLALSKFSFNIIWEKSFINSWYKYKGAINILEAVREIDKYNPRIMLIDQAWRIRKCKRRWDS